MKADTVSIENTDKYIAQFPTETQVLLMQVRQTIQNAAPLATEKISYQMPTFYLYGNLVHFAGYKKHIGFYPGASGIANFQKEISQYKNAKGSVQFPLDEPIPLELITKIVHFRVKQNLEKAVFSDLSAPAQRALKNKGINTPQQLSTFTKEEISDLHGIGPSSFPKLERWLELFGLTFLKKK